MSDLDQLAPKPVIIEMEGRALEITPIKVKELAAMVKAVGPVFDELAAGVSVVELLERHTESIIEIVIIGARCDREWVGERHLAELAELAEAVIAVNADFFTRQIKAAIQRMAARLIPSPGLEPSSDLSAPGTAAAM
jgi:hypothetical protein